MMRVDEYDLELARVITRRLERDDEHERFDARRSAAVARRPRYPRFEALARITDTIALAQAAHPTSIDRSEAA